MFVEHKALLCISLLLTTIIGVLNGLCEHLRVFASIQAVRSFLRAGAVIDFLM